MNWFSLAAAAVVVSVLGVAGCGDKHGPKAQLDPHYQAALAEGIDFRNPDYPSFVVEVAGMSDHEPWGRWTDAAAGPTARFRIKQALPKLLTLEITANAFGPNNGQPIKVRIGGVEKSFVIDAGYWWYQPITNVDSQDLQRSGYGTGTAPVHAKHNNNPSALLIAHDLACPLTA